MAKRPVPLYDFKAFGAAIKAARNEYGESRKKVSDELYISPRYLANIENKGQQPSLTRGNIVNAEDAAEFTINVGGDGVVKATHLIGLLFVEAIS